jgi:hypothetical protein
MNECFCKTAAAIPGNHKCGEYAYSSIETTTTSSVPSEVDVSKMQVVIPLSLLIEIYTMSTTLCETSIRDQVLKILKGV